MGTEQGRSGSDFARRVDSLREALDSLAGYRLILFGGKGGVGKTTLSALTALHLSKTADTTVFTTDPASSLRDLFGETIPPRLTIEELDAPALYDEYLQRNLDSFLELGDRGTYLEKEELRRLFELSLPGIDELMSWLHIGDLVARNHGRITIVDTAPTGHTLRMLTSRDHFARFGEALEAMQQKHRDLVTQLTRRRSRDAFDDFVQHFRADAEARAASFTDPARTSFLPVTLAEPLVEEQTKRLVSELESDRINVPAIILNQSAVDCDCPRCRARRRAERLLIRRFAPHRVVAAPEACGYLASWTDLEHYLKGRNEPRAASKRAPKVVPDLVLPPESRMTFFAGKGGVGKTSTASSVALQLADRHPDRSWVLLSVDPAHSLLDLFRSQHIPKNLRVEAVDTRSRWAELRETVGKRVEEALEGLTPGGLSLTSDQQVMRNLLDIAPPGADEIFAVMKLNDLLEEASLILVDTAPTGHFLRLLDLPAGAGEWVREFMRILLRYRELIPAGSLGEDLVKASKALHGFEEILHSKECSTVVITRAEPLVIRETKRLIDALHNRKMSVASVVANHLAPPSGCSCDRTRRAAQNHAISSLGSAVVMVTETATPPSSFDDLRNLIPLGQTELP